MFAALGRFCYRHRRLVAIAWLALLVAGLGIGSSVFGRLNDPGAARSTESVRGFNVLDDHATTGTRILAVVDRVSVDSPTVRTAVTRVAADLRAMPDVMAVQNTYQEPVPFFRARDGLASIVAVDLKRDLPQQRYDRALDSVSQRLHAVSREAPGAKVLVGGDALLFREINKSVQNDLTHGERLSLPVVLVAMVVIFGGLLAAAIPLLGAVVSIAGALLLLLGASYLIDVSPNVISIVTVLALGLAIDYSLLLVSRFREERAGGSDVAAAVERTCATAGRTIAFSALTVAVSLSGLFVFDDPLYRSMGAAGVGVVLVALAAGLTLIPALLSMWGRRIKVPTQPPPAEGFFSRLTRAVQRRPLPVVLGVALLLAAAALPFLGATFRNAGPGLLPRSFQTREVADTVATRFPGRSADPIVVVAELPASDPRVAAYAQLLRRHPAVAEASVSRDVTGPISAIDVVPVGDSQGAGAQRLVHSLRTDRPDFPTLVTGNAAYLVDFLRSVTIGLPWALALIMVATLVLLFLMTGSLLVPIKALIMNVLSLGASFGALKLIFQDGHLAGLLGFDSTGAIETWVPVIVFVFAFGLSMDYEVFLLARVKELYDAGVPNADAVALGLQRSGRIITSAALVLVVVFAGFSTGQMLGIKEMGLTLGLAVLVDATLVRCLLVPATMSLLGDANWWAPGPLRRLYGRFGVREGGVAVGSSASGASPASSEPVLRAR
ncbi:MAG: MMPL family transporter [Frankiaceae bacterium]